MIVNELIRSSWHNEAGSMKIILENEMERYAWGVMMSAH